MHDRGSFASRPLALALSLLLLVGLAGSAAAQTGPRSVRTEGEFVGYDAAARTVTLKVAQGGSAAAAGALPAGERIVFRVEPEGSVMQRTHVSIRGVSSSLAAIEPGARVQVYWRPDAADPTLRIARRIDVIASGEELDPQRGTE